MQRANELADFQNFYKKKLKKQEEFRNEVRKQIIEKQQRVLNERNKDKEEGIAAQTYTKFINEKLEKLRKKRKQEDQRRYIETQLAEKKSLKVGNINSKSQIDSIILREAKKEIDVFENKQITKKIEKHKLYETLKSDYLKFKNNKIIVRKKEIQEGMKDLENYNKVLDDLENKRNQEKKIRQGVSQRYATLEPRVSHEKVI